jgi:hypothetical protein
VKWEHVIDVGWRKVNIDHAYLRQLTDQELEEWAAIERVREQEMEDLLKRHMEPE